MDNDAFELDGCTLSPECGVGEALDAAGVDGGLDRHDRTFDYHDTFDGDDPLGVGGSAGDADR